MNYKNVDRSVAKKRKDVEGKIDKLEGIPLPAIVEINIFGSCNRSCLFCPVSNPDVYVNKNEGLDLDLARKLCSDLGEIKFKGIILFSAFSEPFLHKNLFDLVSTFRTLLPECSVHLVSNGDAINSKPHLLGKLMQAGAGQLSLSLYDGEHQVSRFQEIIEEQLPEADKHKVILKRRYEQDGNLGLIFSNRAGTLPKNLISDRLTAEVALPLKAGCNYPCYQVVVDYNGDVMMCAHDWEKKGIVGNINNQRFWDIWSGTLITEYRERLLNANRRFAPCVKCDVRGDLIGDSHKALFAKSIK